MITQRTDHEAAGLSLLVTQYKGKPRLEAFIASHLAQVQALESVFFQILDILINRDGQVGEQLDLIGRVVGQAREGMDDATFLAWIKARILVNRSSGAPDEFYQVCELVAPEAARRWDFYYPGAFVLNLIPLANPATVCPLLRGIGAAGVGRWVHSLTEVELMPNAGFDNWSYGDQPAGWSVGVGVGHYVTQTGSGQAYGGTGSGSINLYATGDGVIASLWQYLNLVEGENYVCEITVSYVEGLGGVLFCDEGYTTTPGAGVALSAPGTYTMQISATVGSAYGSINVDTHENSQITIDSISVKHAGAPLLFTFSDTDSEALAPLEGFGTGDELLLNDSFDTWAAGAPSGWDVPYDPVFERGSGHLNAGSGTGACNFFNETSAVIGQTGLVLETYQRYEVEVVISAVGYGSVDVFDDLGSLFWWHFDTVGTHRFIFYSQDHIELELMISSSDDADLTIDSVSVRKLGWSGMVDSTEI